MPGMLKLMGSNALETGNGKFRYDFHFTDNDEYDNIVYSVHSSCDIDLSKWKDIFSMEIIQDLAEEVSKPYTIGNPFDKYTLLFVEKVKCSEILTLTETQRRESEKIIENGVKELRDKLGK